MFKKIGAWFAKVWKSLKDTGAHAAVVITEDIKTALDSGVVGWLATVVEKLIPTVGQLPEELVSAMKAVIVKVLAAELALEGLPDNPTQDDVLAFEQKVLTAFGLLDDKSKLYTTLGAQLFGIIKKHNDETGSTSWTFFQLAEAVEEAYQDYVADQQDATAEG